MNLRQLESKACSKRIQEFMDAQRLSGESVWQECEQSSLKLQPGEESSSIRLQVV